MIYTFNLFNYIGGLIILFFSVAFWAWSKALGFYIEIQPVMTIVPIMMVVSLYLLAILDTEMKLISDEINGLDKAINKE